MRFQSTRPIRPVLLAPLLGLAACVQAVGSTPESPAGTGAGAASEVPAESAIPCAGRAVKDDGSVETGYGYVPSATMGQYVQAFDAGELEAGKVEAVCVCWLRTRDDGDLDFEVVFYRDAGGRPEAEPYAAVAATATDVPRGVEAAGRFYEVDVGGVALPPGRSYVGVRWDPSASTFFFVCTDTSEETEWVDVFSMEDRAPRWTNVKDSRDPIFEPHRAIGVRAR